MSPAIPAPIMTISTYSVAPSVSAVASCAFPKGDVSIPAPDSARSAAVMIAMLVNVAPLTASTVKLCSLTMRLGTSDSAGSDIPGVS